MKKLAAISLLLLMILHLVGYYFILIIMDQQHEMNWQSEVTNDTFENYDLQSKSIPITFPYQTNQKEFQVVDEKIEFKGKIYRVIKMRYASDTLHIVYVNDQKSEEIQESLNLLSDQFGQNDKKSQSSSVRNTLIRLICNSYIQQNYVFSPLAFDIKKTKYYIFYNQFYQHVFPNIPVPPPKSVSIS